MGGARPLSGRQGACRMTVKKPIAAYERVLATILVAIGPLLSTIAVAVAAHLVGIAKGGGVSHLLAISVGWLAGALAMIRLLRRRWPDGAGPSSARLLLAAAASLVAVVALGVVTAPWQDVMSESGATPLMAAKDLTSQLAPLLAAVLAPWFILAPRRA